MRLESLNETSDYANNQRYALTGPCCSHQNLPMAGSDKRKQSLYFPEEMLTEIQAEAARQDRSLRWIVQKAWRIARRDIQKFPAVNEFPGQEDPQELSSP